MLRVVRPHARRRTAAALAVVAALTLSGCADDVDPSMPEESRSPAAGEESPREESGSADAPAEEPAGEEAEGKRADALARPASWPQGLVWPPVDGVVEQFTTSPDGSLRLVTEVRDRTTTPAVKGFVSDWVDSLIETAHSVSTTGGWGSGVLELVVTAQHPQQVIRTDVTREGSGEPVTVQVLLTPIS